MTSWTNLPSKTEVRAEKCRRRLYDFVRHGWPVVEPGTPLIDNWHLQAVCEHLEAVTRGDIRQLLINIPPGHMKCIARGTRVHLADGSLKNIEDISPSDTVISLSNGYNITASPVVNTADNGVKPVLRITLRSGRHVLCTENHPLLTIHGWERAENLKIGDCIASARRTDFPDAEPLPFGLAALMGYITGDGSCTMSTVYLTASEPQVRAHVEQIAGHHGWAVTPRPRFGLAVVNALGKKGNSRDGTAPIAVMRGYMPWGVKSREKRVPECIFRANRQDTADFLAAYFNADGAVNNRREGVVTFSSTSEGLLRDVQILLTRFGIYSSLRTHTGKYKGEPHLSYELLVTGGDLVKLSDAIPALGDRGQRLREAADSRRSVRPLPEYDCIPNGWKKYLTRSVNHHRTVTGVRVDKNCKYGVARHIVEAVAKAEGNEYLERLCSPDVLWERITDIEQIGDLPTYDIEVAPTHNFLADGVFVHNSLLVSVFWPAWEWIEAPETRSLFSSYAMELAIRDSVRCRDLVTSDWYAEWFAPVWRLRADQNLKSYFENDRKGFRFCLSVGGRATGFRGGKVVVDDPLNAKDVRSAAALDECIFWWDQVMSTRLNDPRTGARVIIMQRLHEKDLSGHVLARGGYEHLCLPSEFDPARRSATCIGWEDPRTEPDELLFPELFPAPVLAELKEVLGAVDYAGQHDQHPVPKEGAYFKVSQLRIVDAAPAGLKWVRAWDQAATEGGGDFTAGVLMGTPKDKSHPDHGVFFVRDVTRGQWGTDTRNAQIRQTAALDGTDVRILGAQDPGSAGKDAALTFTRLLAGYSVKTERVSGDKETRADPFSAQVNAGNVRLVKGAWNQAFIDELRTFPLGAHDDQVDGGSDAFNDLTLTPETPVFTRSAPSRPRFR